MKIGNIELKSNIFAAPMAGYSEAGYRYLAGESGAGLTYTEMISAKGIVYGSEKTFQLLYKSKKDNNKTAVQIFGSEPEFIYKACKSGVFEKFEIIDINMGCPVRKIVNNGDGSKLLENPKLAGEIVRAAIEGSRKPVTAKIRSGIDSSDVLAYDVALELEKAGCSAVTIHPRTRVQMYQGTANHEITKNLKKLLKIPVIANGDIKDKDSFENIKNKTDADAYMVGRASLGNPGIFSELLNRNEVISKYYTVLEHIAVLNEYMPQHIILNLIKSNLCFYLKGLSNVKEIKMKVVSLNNYQDLMLLINNEIKNIL